MLNCLRCFPARVSMAYNPPILNAKEEGAIPKHFHVTGNIIQPDHKVYAPHIAIVDIFCRNTVHIRFKIAIVISSDAKASDTEIKDAADKSISSCI